MRLGYTSSSWFHEETEVTKMLARQYRIAGPSDPCRVLRSTQDSSSPPEHRKHNVVLHAQAARADPDRRHRDPISWRRIEDIKFITRQCLPVIAAVHAPQRDRPLLPSREPVADLSERRGREDLEVWRTMEDEDVKATDLADDAPW